MFLLGRPIFIIVIVLFDLDTPLNAFTMLSRRAWIGTCSQPCA